MSERKRWPNHAEWARVEAMAQAYRGIKALALLINGHEQVPRPLVIVNDALLRIIISLQQVGPQAPNDKNAGPTIEE